MNIKALEGNGRGLLNILFLNSTVGADENHDKPAVWSVAQPRLVPSTSQMKYKIL